MSYDELSHILHFDEQGKDLTFRRRASDGKVVGHQPIYGLGRGPAGPNHILRLARTCRIFEILDQLEFSTLLDVGGGEGFNAYRAKRLWDCQVVSTDHTILGNRVAGDLFGVANAAIDGALLPFKDNSFDVVICSEVIEHIPDAVTALLQLSRVARKCVIITTAEATASKVARWLNLRLIYRDWRDGWTQNWYHHKDFKVLYGDQARVELALNTVGFRTNRDESQLSSEDAIITVRQLMSIDAVGNIPDGVLVSLIKDKGSYRAKPQLGIEKIITEVVNYPGIDRVPTSEKLEPDRELLLDALQCPACWQPLTHASDGTATCATGHTFSSEEGVLNLRPDTIAAYKDNVFARIMQSYPLQSERQRRQIEHLRKTLLTHHAIPSRLKERIFGYLIFFLRVTCYPFFIIRKRLRLVTSPFADLAYTQLPPLQKRYDS